MKNNLFTLVSSALVSAFMLSGCDNIQLVQSEGDSLVNNEDLPLSDDDVISEEILAYDGDGIVVSLPEWEMTKAYSRTDLTTPQMSPGEEVGVMDDKGKLWCFIVKESDNHTAILENPEVELQEGGEYRILYPHPVVREQYFIMPLGFGSYESTPTLDWMVSKWKKFKKNEVFHFNLKRVNSVLIFDVIAPFDCRIDEIRLSTDDAVFCIKGAFDCTEDDLFPERTTWTSEFLFPLEGMDWVKGEKYTLILTLWPFDYSSSECTLDIYTMDGRGASAPVSIPDIKAGKIKEYEITEFSILDYPVVKKEECMKEYEGYPM